MEEVIIQRIRLFMDRMEFNETQLSVSIGVSPVNVNRWLRNTTMPMSLIYKILECHPNLSAEWLLRGKGEMFITDDKGNSTVFDKLLSSITSCGDSQYYESLLDMRDKRIRELERENNTLNKMAQARIGGSKDLIV